VYFSCFAVIVLKLLLTDCSFCNVRGGILRAYGFLAGILPSLNFTYYSGGKKSDGSIQRDFSLYAVAKKQIIIPRKQMYAQV
jgi:hypothetical protein